MARLAIQRHFAGLSRNTFLLAFASLFADISTEMLYPVLTVFLTQTLKARGSVVGLVDGFALATQNIVQGFSGSLSDKLHRRKSLALVGYFLAAIAKPLMGLSTTWQGVFGARVLDRFGAGTRSAPRDALIASSVAEKDRGRAFGMEGVGDNAGAFLGPLLAALLLYSLHIGIREIFYLAVVPGLLAFFMVLLVTENPSAVAAKSKIDIGLRQFPRGYWRTAQQSAYCNSWPALSPNSCGMAPAMHQYFTMARFLAPLEASRCSSLFHKNRTRREGRAERHAPVCPSNPRSFRRVQTRRPSPHQRR